MEVDHGVSPQLRWQCWSGTDWIDTHQLTRNGPTAEIAPGETVTSIATLLFVPDDFLITIPEVAPGRYRIKETGFGQDGPTGYVIVEVLSPDE